MTTVARVAVSAPCSGHGKTAVAVGLLAAYAARGLTTAGFKIGPDHADAAYLGLASGRPGRNIDPRLVGTRRIAPLFAHGAAGADLAVVEGTMGLFDSIGEHPETDSTAAVCVGLRAPVVLVVDAAAMGHSVAALVHGFRAYDELVQLGGVILNRVASDHHERLLREALDDIGVPVFGALRRQVLSRALPGREHGVVPVAHRSLEAYRGVRRLGEAITGAVDLDRILALARSAPQLPVDRWSASAAAAEGLYSVRSGSSEDRSAGVAGAGGGPPDPPAPDPAARVPRPVVALAGGPGTAYSYPETAELLVAAGAEVRVLDPLRDEALPAGTAALVVGGGLPESYAEELSANQRLCAAVADFARAGHPVLAEGTGALWLAREFDGRPMCGVLDATGVGTGHVVIGYREATAQAPSVVAQPGDRLFGYKQHAAVLLPRAGQTPAWRWPGGPPEGFVWGGVHASQLILHWAGVPGIARRLVAAAFRHVDRPDVLPTGPGSGSALPPLPAASAAPVSPAAPVSALPLDSPGRVMA